jgi:hypothetical protein
VDVDMPLPNILNRSTFSTAPSCNGAKVTNVPSSCTCLLGGNNSTGFITPTSKSFTRNGSYEPGEIHESHNLLLLTSLGPPEDRGK